MKTTRNRNLAAQSETADGLVALFARGERIGFERLGLSAESAMLLLATVACRPVSLRRVSCAGGGRIVRKDS
jgi:hypothetical protein